MLAFNPTTGRPGFGRKATQIAIHESGWPKKLTHFKIPTVLFCSNARWLNARILVAFPKRKRPASQSDASELPSAFGFGRGKDFSPCATLNGKVSKTFQNRREPDHEVFCSQRGGPELGVCG